MTLSHTFTLRRFAILVALLLPGCGGSTPLPPLVIGHVAAFSGVEGRAGQQTERGIQLALEELGATASDNLAGRPIAVRHVDAGSDLDTYESVAARLVSVNHALGILGGSTKDEALRLDRSRVPVLSPLGQRSSAMSDLLFTTGITPTQQGEALAKHLADAPTVPLVLVVDERRPESQAAAAAFRRAWSETPGLAKLKADVQPIEFTLTSDEQLPDLTQRLTKSMPKTIVFAGQPKDLRVLQRDVQTPGATWGLLCDDGGYSGLTPGADATLLVVTAFATGKDAGKAGEFAKRFYAKFSQEPDVHAALAFDEVNLLVEALRKGQSVTPEKLREELLKIKDFAGVTGPIGFGGGQQLHRAAFIARIDRAAAAPIALKLIAP